MTKQTLYERMGGDSQMILAVSDFYAEILRDKDLQPFFEHISVSALEVHQLKLFRVLYGPPEEKPGQDEFFQFILATHTRLFRDQGLTEVHFDKVAEALVRAFQAQLYNQDLIDEAVAELAPLRAVFQHGAKVAAREKTYTVEQIRVLPTTAAASIGTDEPTVLPDPSWIDTPHWLQDTLRRHSQNEEVRAWTKDLIDRFGVCGDKVVADTFMDMPYMNHHVFACALMQLAFLPQDVDPSDLLDVVRHPRGPHRSLLWAVIWERMTVHFQRTCEYMLMDAEVYEKGIEKLRSYKHLFRQGEVKIVGGVTSPHVLRRSVPQEPHFDVSAIQKHTKRKGPGSVVSDTCTETTVSEGAPSPTDTKVKKRKGKWRRLLGWVRA